MQVVKNFISSPFSSKLADQAEIVRLKGLEKTSVSLHNGLEKTSVSLHNGLEKTSVSLHNWIDKVSVSLCNLYIESASFQSVILLPFCLSPRGQTFFTHRWGGRVAQN